MGWKTGLPCHWPYDNSRRSMSHCPSHNRSPSEGKGARMTMCKSASPTTLQVWLSKRFSHKGYLQGWWLWLSTITTLAPQGAETTINVGGTKGLHHLGCHHLPQIVGLRVTGAHYWWLPQCCPGLIGQMDPGILDEGDGTKRMELTGR